MRLDSCTGPLLATAPLKPAVDRTALTTLHTAIPPTTGVHDLCFTFARPQVDPFWALDAVSLEPGDGS